jgi:hypothetical protein
MINSTWEWLLTARAKLGRVAKKVSHTKDAMAGGSAHASQKSKSLEANFGEARLRMFIVPVTPAIGSLREGSHPCELNPAAWKKFRELRRGVVGGGTLDMTRARREIEYYNGDLVEWTVARASIGCRFGCPSVLTIGTEEVQWQNHPMKS